MARWAAFSSILAHISLLAFTILLDMQSAHRIHISWWWVFMPLWVFHVSIVNCRCSIPGPSPPPPGISQWNPWHGMVGLPLLLSFELLLCTHLNGRAEGLTENVVDLEIVFLPLLVLEAIIMVDNMRRCVALTPEDEPITDDALHDTFPHCGVSVAMLLFMVATVGICLKITAKLDVTWWLVLLPLWGGEIFGMLPLCPTDPIEAEHMRRRAVTARISSHSTLPIRPPPRRLPPPSAGFNVMGSPQTGGARSDASSAGAYQQLPGEDQGAGRAVSPMDATPSGIGRSGSTVGIVELHPESSLMRGDVDSGNRGQGGGIRRARSGDSILVESVQEEPPDRRADSFDSMSDASGSDEDVGVAGSCLLLWPPNGGLWLAIGAFLLFQTLLCAVLEKPQELRTIPLEAVFAPIWVLQTFLVFASLARLALPRLHATTTISSIHSPLLTFVTSVTTLAEEGGKVLAWIPIPEDIQNGIVDERSSILPRGALQSYSTFDSPARALLAEGSDEEMGATGSEKKSTRRELQAKVRGLRTALREETKVSERRRQELDYVLQEMVVCRICYEGSINVVLLPCRHHMLCHKCARKCKHCPFCRSIISERMVVYPV